MSHERMAPRWPEGSRPRHFFGVSFPASVFTTEAGNGNSLNAFSGTHLAHPFLSILDAWVTHRPGFTSEAQALQAWPETWVR